MAQLARFFQVWSLQEDRKELKQRLSFAQLLAFFRLMFQLQLLLGLTISCLLETS